MPGYLTVLNETEHDITVTMDPQQRRAYAEIKEEQIEQAKAILDVEKSLLSLLKKHYATLPDVDDDSLYLCPKCQNKSHYDPKATHGICPACWSVMGISERSALTGEWYTFCNSDCGWFTTERDDWKGTHGYCEECWLKLAPEQRAILKGEEPLPPQETRIVHLPAVPSPWKVFGVSILATALAIAACSVAGYFLVLHLHW